MFCRFVANLFSHYQKRLSAEAQLNLIKSTISLSSAKATASGIPSNDTSSAAATAFLTNVNTEIKMKDNPLIRYMREQAIRSSRALSLKSSNRKSTSEISTSSKDKSTVSKLLKVSSRYLSHVLRLL